jgi:hypothetical protein
MRPITPAIVASSFSAGITTINFIAVETGPGGVYV